MERELDGAVGPERVHGIDAESRQRQGGVGGSIEAYAHDWLAAFDAALSGEYGPQRLVSDVARISSRLVRDTAKLYVSGFEAVKTLANMPTSTTTTVEDPESAGWDPVGDPATIVHTAKPGP
jgi:hypothetical protein